MSLRLLGITNSLRPRSLNRQVLRLVGESAPAEVHMEEQDLRGIPFYDAELEESGFPCAVMAFGASLAACDGLVLCSPEYNHSVPAVLKNAIDWASRLPERPLEGKPVMIISATTGMLGGARVQYEWRRVLDAVGAVPMVRPEAFIGDAHRKFQDGRCIDARTRQVVERQIQAFCRALECSPRSVRLGTEQA